MDTIQQEIAEIAAQLAALSARLQALSEKVAPASEPEPQSEPAPEPEPAPAPEPEPAPEPVEIDLEPVAEPKIRFALNDRYRFRRELFNNSDADMARVVAAVEAMTSAAEVREYLADALGWDLDAPVAADFYAAVARHFETHPPLLG